MSTYQCPKGHESTESDYCSECGTKIAGAIEQVLTIPKTPENSISCPDCSAPHDPESGVFCEICGYNFVTGAHGEVPPVAMYSPSSLIIEMPPNGKLGEEDKGQNNLISHTQFPTWEITITIDQSLGTDESPEPPINQPLIILKLEKDSNLIGRRSEVRGIYPEIPLDFDDAVSHRHALINRQPDGSFVLRDIGSTNGTKLNGKELKEMVDTPLKDGDEFTLGHWTRIKVKVIGISQTI